MDTESETNQIAKALIEYRKKGNKRIIVSRKEKITNDYKTLEQQIISLWKSRGMTVKVIEVNYPVWKITIEEIKK